jgi:HK97 gp10 family phage protein
MINKKTKFYGFSEWNYLVEQINKDFGVANTRENVLVPAARNAMKIALAAAKANLKPNHGLDTGQLQRTLTVGARATNKRDWRSHYVKAGDIVVATVSAKLKKKYVNGVNLGDVSDARAIATEFGTKNKNTAIEKPTGMSKRGHEALQREFGTVRLPPRPYLRPALEKNQVAISAKLGEEIARLLAKYKSTVLTGK